MLLNCAVKVLLNCVEINSANLSTSADMAKTLKYACNPFHYEARAFKAIKQIRAIDENHRALELHEIYAAAGYHNI